VIIQRLSASSAPRAFPKHVNCKPDDFGSLHNHACLLVCGQLHDVAIWAPFDTFLTICSQIGLLVDGAVWLKKYFHNDEVDVREKFQDAVPVALLATSWKSCKKVATDQNLMESRLGHARRRPVS
jgi:hypothetical protein